MKDERSEERESMEESLREEKSVRDEKSVGEKYNGADSMEEVSVIVSSRSRSPKRRWEEIGDDTDAIKKMQEMEERCNEMAKKLEEMENRRKRERRELETRLEREQDERRELLHERRELETRLKREQDERKREQDERAPTLFKYIWEENVPKMKENQGCKPSLLSNEDGRKNTLHRRNGIPSDQKVKWHDVAKIHRMDLDESLVAKVKVSLRTKGGEEIPSRFATRCKTNDQTELQHANEACPQTYVAELLEDILLCLWTSGTVTKEATVFSLRPDLVVVLYMGRLVLAVEIKNPGEEVFSSEVAAGQVYDYLKGLTSYGHESPLVVLSTYNEMVLSWLSGTENEVLALFGEAAEMEISAFSRPNSDETKQAVSPDRSSSSVSHASNLPPIQDEAEREIQDEAERDDDDRKDDETYYDAVDYEETKFDYRGREVCYTQLFNYKKAPRVLALALKSSLLTIERCTWKGLMVPQHGLTMKREVCFHHKDGFTWGTISAEANYNARPVFRDGYRVAVLGALGQGSTGKCFLCCSTAGTMYVSKLYIPKASTSYTGDDRDAERKEALELSKQQADRELKLWEEFAPPKYSQFCSVISQNGVPSLVMPYFAPVAMEKRRGVLRDVKKLLLSFAEKDYAYKGSDLRWRHVVRRGRHVFLIDLESLKEHSFKDDEERRTFVDGQIWELTKRMRNEAATANLTHSFH